MPPKKSGRKPKEKTPEDVTNKHVVVTRTSFTHFSKFVKDEELGSSLRQTIVTCNDLVTDAYTFVKLLLLTEYQRLETTPFKSAYDRLNAYSQWLTDQGPWKPNYFGQILSFLCTPTNGKHRGRPYKEDVRLFINGLKESYQAFLKEGLFDKIQQERCNLSYIMAYTKTGMKTAFENNVLMHYDKYPRKLIRVILRNHACEVHQVENYRDLDSSVKAKYNSLTTQAIQWVLFKGQALTDEGIQSLIRERWTCLGLPPPNVDYCDPSLNVPLHLAFMITINRELERLNVKGYSPIPLRRNLVPCSVLLDTSALIDLMPETSFKRLALLLEDACGFKLPHLKLRSHLFDSPLKLVNEGDREKINPIAFKTVIWTCLFDFSSKKLKEMQRSLEKKGLVFNNMMSTDGYRVNLHFTDENSYAATRFQKGSILCGAKREGGPVDDFKYVQDLSEEERAVYHDPEVMKLYLDPGKGNIITVTTGESKAKKLMYSGIQRRSETYQKRNRQEYEALISVATVTTGQTIKEVLESPALCETNSKSSFLEQFKKYRLARKEVSVDVKSFFEWTCHRRRRLRARIGKQKSEAQLVNRIIKTFDLTVDEKGKVTNGVIIWGNWGKNPNLKNQAPSPGIGLRRVVHQRIRTWTCDERYTSSVCPTCDGKVAKAEKEKPFWDKKTRTLIKKNQTIHHLLRCNNAKCKSRWWNRDVLGTMNMKRQASSYIDRGKPHDALRNPKDLPEVKQG